VVDQQLFRLCETVGCPHPDYLPEDFTASQLVDWATYWAVDPSRPNEAHMEQDLIRAIRAAKGG